MDKASDHGLEFSERFVPKETLFLQYRNEEENQGEEQNLGDKAVLSYPLHPITHGVKPILPHYVFLLVLSTTMVSSLLDTWDC